MNLSKRNKQNLEIQGTYNHEDNGEKDLQL